MHPQALIEEPPLSQREEKLLADLEGVIETNMKGFVLVGMALATIKNQKLYRIQYPTFEEYLLRVWDIAARTAYQLIEAAYVHENLKDFLERGNLNNCSQIENVNHSLESENVRHGAQTEIILPKNERQARPLTLFSPEEQKEIWLRVLDEASNRNCVITANFIIQVILERQRKEIEKRTKTNRERADKQLVLPPMVQQSYQMLLQVVLDQNDAGWKQVGKQTMVELLEDLLETLKG